MATKNKASDRLTADDRHQLKTSDYGLPKEKKFPMPDGEHVHAAESYFRYAKADQKPELARNILKKADKFGVEVKSKTIREWAKK